MNDFGLIDNRTSPNAPTFTLTNRIKRTLWRLVWIVAARWTPPPMHRWRVFLLNIWGAHVDSTAHVYASVEVWAPWNLRMLPFGSMGPQVRCYNIAPITIGERATVSQGAYLCTGTHDFRDPEMPLVAREIQIGARAWICADALVGPGVSVGDGAVLAAAGVTFRDLDAWTVYVGNPAEVRGNRPPIAEVSPQSGVAAK